MHSDAGLEQDAYKLSYEYNSVMKRIQVEGIILPDFMAYYIATVKIAVVVVER